jgi:hypothetical protein
MFSVGCSVRISKPNPDSTRFGDQVGMAFEGQVGLIVEGPTWATPNTWEVSVPGIGHCLLCANEMEVLVSCPVGLVYNLNGSVTIVYPEGRSYETVTIAELLVSLRHCQVTSITYEVPVLGDPVVR